MTNGRLDQFESFVSEFRPVFHRADQALRFRSYLRGLLEPLERKNVESIATAVSQLMMVESDLAQALQHFVSHSPWDSRRLNAAVLDRSRKFRDDPDAVWVIHDGSFAKKGQHSVGVHRQLARSIGKKINCQLAVFVSQVGPAGFFPLAIRLYLPNAWIKENGETALKGIPEEYRQPASKSQIAVELLEALREVGEPVKPVVADVAYTATNDWQDQLAAKGFTALLENQSHLDQSLAGLEWLKNQLGLDHFEGRTWHGWHHHATLVFTAYTFLAMAK